MPALRLCLIDDVPIVRSLPSRARRVDTTLKFATPFHPFLAPPSPSFVFSTLLCGSVILWLNYSSDDLGSVTNMTTPFMDQLLRRGTLQ